MPTQARPIGYSNKIVAWPDVTLSLGLSPSVTSALARATADKRCTMELFCEEALTHRLRGLGYDVDPPPAPVFPRRPGEWRVLPGKGRSRLTEEQVREIKASPEGPSALARRYGVHRNAIWDIRRGRTWKDVA